MRSFLIDERIKWSCLGWIIINVYNLFLWYYTEKEIILGFFSTNIVFLYLSCYKFHWTNSFLKYLPYFVNKQYMLDKL